MQAGMRPPVTLWQIAMKILKSMPLSLLRSLVFAIFLMPIVWLVHSYLIVFPNDGFQGGGNWFLSTVLCLKGQVISSVIFWFLIGSVIPAIIGGMWRAGGPVRYFSQIGDLVARIIDVSKKIGRRELPYVIGGVLGVCLLQPLTHNTITNLVFLLFILRGLIAFNEGSFLAIVGRAAQYDFNRKFRKDKPWMPVPIDLLFIVYAGMAAGVLLMAFPLLQNLAIGVAIVLVIVYLVSRGNKPQSSTGIFILLAVSAGAFFAAAGSLFADDGGAPEFGIKTLGDALKNPDLFRKWLATDSAQTCLRMGIPPAISLWFGGAFADAFLRTLRNLAGSTNGTFPPVPPATTPEPAQPEDPFLKWKRDYESRGWRYDETRNTLIPREGAVDDEGKIYMRSPYENDPNRLTWVPADQAAQIRDQTAQGKVWDPRYGWGNRGDQQSLYRDDQRRWDDFRKQDKGIADLQAQQASDNDKLEQLQDLRRDAALAGAGADRDLYQGIDDKIDRILHGDGNTVSDNDINATRDTVDRFQKTMDSTEAFRQQSILDGLAARRSEMAYNAVNTLQYTCDRGVDLLEGTCGPVGKTVAFVYTGSKGIAHGIGNSIVKLTYDNGGITDVIYEMGKGGVEGLADLGIKKGMEKLFPGGEPPDGSNLNVSDLVRNPGSMSSTMTGALKDSITGSGRGAVVDYALVNPAKGALADNDILQIMPKQ